ncbi:MAG TPA: phosphoribosylglycinamide formyltransferase [Methanoregulaceae archaeon]|nr:phosphoribosylglycinamide formyltransferase [Methanoregulaceae archaeon]
MKRFAVLASGRGSNFQALIDVLERGEIPAVCCGLITDNPSAYAIQRARDAGIPVQIVNFSEFPSKEAYEKELKAAMVRCNAHLFILAGYMRIVGEDIVRKFAGMMINIHPALLPSFPGLHAQKQALEYGVRVTGCTVHFVDEQMDNGPIIIQVCVPVLDGDDEETLADRILVEEHRCLPEAVRLFCEDRVHIEGRRVRIS